MSSNKTVAILGAALAVAVLAAASPEPRPSELVVWHAYRGSERAAFEKVVAAYNSAHRGKVLVTTLAVPYDAYADKISAAVPRGKGPDVFIYAQDRLGGWIEAGNTISPLDFFLDGKTLDRYLPASVEAMTYQGSVYGLPLNYKVIAQIYNKRLISAPPRTSGELVAVAKRLTDSAAGRFGLAYAYNDFYYHAAVFNAFGGGVFDTSSKPILNSPANVKALEYVMGWLDDDRILPAEPSTALITTLFNGGRAAIVFSGPWFLGEVAPEIDYGVAPLPRIDEAGAPMRPWMTVEGVYVAAPSRRQEEAFDFALYLTGTEAAKVLALEGRQTPAVRAVYELAEVAADPVIRAFREQVEVALPMPNLPEMTVMWSPATTAMNLTVKKSMSPRAALERAQAEVEERIAALRR